MQKLLRLITLLTFAITTGVIATSNASAAMINNVSNTVADTFDTVQHVFRIMAAAPAQPAAPKAVPGNKSATVSWTAPINNGSTITSYTVTSLPGEFTCTTSALTCVVNGLTNETAYTFSVTATNGLGTSLRSAESTSTIPTHTPRLLTSQALVSGQSGAVAYSSDGRYAIWGTQTAPAQVVKYDLETKSVVETLTLDSASTAIKDASASETEAFFFYAGGYVAIDIEGMYVTKSGA
ncbi:MAG: hypothetical protein RL146_488, partial [Actinomycetota bacterium]